MAKKNNILKVRFSSEEIEFLDRAVVKLEGILNFNRSEIIRRGARDFALKVLSAKELKIVGLE